MLDAGECRVRFFDYVRSYRDVDNYRAAQAVEKSGARKVLEARLKMPSTHLKADGFLHNTSLIPPLVVYGASVLLLLVILTLARVSGRAGHRAAHRC